MRRKLAEFAAVVVAAAAVVVAVNMPAVPAAESAPVLVRPVGSAEQPRAHVVDVATLPDRPDPLPPALDLGEVELEPDEHQLPISVDPVSPPPGPAGGSGSPMSIQSSSGPQQLTQFPGIPDQNTVIQPDTTLAVGPTSMIELTRALGTVFSRSGAALHNFTPSGLFGGPADPTKITTPVYTDPKVVYDATSSRFFATTVLYDGCATCPTKNNSEVRIAVSSSSDPAGTWYSYQVEYMAGYILDQPKLGVSSDKVLVASNPNTTTKPAVLQKSDLVSGATVLIDYFAADNTRFNMVPARQVTSTTTAYAATADNSRVTLFKFSGTPRGTGGVTYTWQDFGITTLQSFPGGRQPGGTVSDAGWRNARHAVWRSGTLWVVSSTGCVPSGDSASRTCIRFDQLNTSTNTLVRDVDYGKSGLDLLDPAVVTTAAGDVYASFSQMSTSVNPTAAMLYAPAGSITSAVSPYTFGSGVRQYDYSTGWGDYSDADIDPTNSNKVWLAAEYGSTQSTGSKWATGIAQYAAVTVTSLSPSGGPTAGGTSVMIGGGGFTGATSVTFGGTAASFTVNSDSQITATAPAHSSGSVPVVVTAGGWTNLTTTSSQYGYALPAPAVGGLNPNIGPTAGGNSVWISGSSFTGATAVKFGGVTASFSVQNDSTILATAPAHAAGDVYVQVTTPSGTSAQNSLSLYTYANGPNVTGVDPTSGTDQGGDFITVYGTSWSGITGVLFGGTPAPYFDFVSSTELRVETPAHNVGTVHVQVQGDGGTSQTTSSDLFEFIHQDVVIDYLDTTRGPTAGGQQFTIYGSGFTNVTDVTFGGISADYFSAAGSTISVITPPHSAGTVHVQVITQYASSPLTSVDLYTFQNPPVVTGVSPAYGLTLGGDTVTISGHNFTGAQSVRFGSYSASFTVLSDTQIRATSPAVPVTAIGYVDVQVYAADRLSAVNTQDRFLYL